MLCYLTVWLLVCLFPTVRSECQPVGRGQCVCQIGGYSYNVGEDYYSFSTETFFTAAPEEAADIVFIVDESKSMSTEHTWLKRVALDLNNELVTKYIGHRPEAPNRFGLVTFGARNPSRGAGHIVPVGSSGNHFGSSDDLVEALSSLHLTGRWEDGYQGIVTALKGYQFRPNVAKQFILVTDENRDNLDPDLTYNQTLSDLTNASVVLNAVVNQAFDQDGRSAFGLEKSGKVYLRADNKKGFISAYNGRPVQGAGDGTTLDDYVSLALETRGAAWNLQLLRLGGKIARSFTKAFIDVKVKEITRQLRTCHRCTCERDDPDTCVEFEVQTQAECPIPNPSPTPPSTGIVEKPSCRISGNPLNDGSVGRQYVIKSNGNFNSNSSYPSADVVFVVDESGSMEGEHEWLRETIYYLDHALRDEGIGKKVPNRYGLVGFATSPRVNGAIHPLGVGSTQMGTPTEFATEIKSLATAGQVEDGYRAIKTALNGFQFRTGNVARQIILVTDEDRDNTIGVQLTDIKQLLEQKEFRINVIVNHGFLDSGGERILGIDARHNGYKADNSSKGYQSVPRASAFKDSGHGTTLDDYVMLAMDTEGAAWDLNQLRKGGKLAQSFTNSFVDAKVEEISEQLRVCQQCSCSQSRLTCTDIPEASNADQCYRQGACKVGSDYLDPGEKYCSYSIFQDISSGLAPQAAADIMIVVDESRSMMGEHHWLKFVVERLDTALQAKSVGRVTPNRFGLIGYANNGSDREDALGTILMMDKKTHRMMGSANEFRKAVKWQLRQSGKHEDGYTAIMRALKAKNFRSGTAKLMILVTDEDRDVLDRNINFTSVYNALYNEKVILNAVVNQGFESGGAVALGIDRFRNAYFMNKTTVGGKRLVGYKVKKNGQPVPDSGYGSTYRDYTSLALKTEGGAWDLNRLRKGGAVAKAFTQAFVAVKVQEALSQLETCRVCMCEYGNLLCRAFESNRTACNQACLVRGNFEPLPDNFISQTGIGGDIQRPVSAEVLPTSLEVCLGDTPLISCRARAFNGTVKVNWSHKGKPVSSIRQNNDQRNLARELRFKVNNVEDAGDFTCTATAHGFRAIADATVTVADTCLNNCGHFLGEGYATVYRGRLAAPHIHITMRFCPTSVISGVLHCLEGTGTSNCAQCLVLEDGFLELRWSCCLPGKSLLLQQLSVAADKCHTTTFTTTNTEAIVELNGEKQIANLQSTCWDDFEPSRVVSLGGHDFAEGYNGCMNNIEIDRKPVYFSSDDLPKGRVLVVKKKRRMMRCTHECSP